jgi:glycosyltransferase involved in cell wall biosynthesis
MLYVDISPAVHARAGLGRYSENLAAALIQAQPERMALFYNRGRDGRFPPSLPATIPQRSIRAGYKPWRMAILLAQWARLPFNRLVPDAALYHSTEHLLMPLRGVPVILTIHDLIPKLFPAYHKKLNYWYLNLAMPLFCRRAQAIIAVSHSTKRDIVTHYGIDPGKIHVVHEAAAEIFQPPPAAQIDAVRRKYGLPEQFLIHLSTIEPRKNLFRLVEALKIVRREHPQLALVLAGAKGWLMDDFFAQIAADGMQDAVQLLGWVPDEDLPAVLAAADLAVQPSLYEGFGLPLLEHMASGQVVAASNRSSHPEIGGEAVAFFDPENSAEMAAVIARLLTDREEHAHRRALGLAQAQKFSWRQTAEETLQVYAKVLG